MKFIKEIFQNLGNEMSNFDLFVGDTLEDVVDSICQSVSNIFEFLWIALKTLTIVLLYILFLPITIILLIAYIIVKRKRGE